MLHMQIDDMVDDDGRNVILQHHVCYVVKILLFNR